MHAETIRAECGFVDVQVACIKGEPSLEAALAVIPRPVVAVPLLMADGFIMQLLQERLAGEAGVELRRPVGVDPRLTDLIARKNAETCARQGWEPTRSTLLLVAHGTPRHAESATSTRQHAERLAVRTDLAEIRTAFLDQPNFLAEVALCLDRPCVAVGLFIDDGPHGRDDVLDGLAHADVPLVYTGALGSDPAFAELILMAARLPPSPIPRREDARTTLRRVK